MKRCGQTIILTCCPPLNLALSSAAVDSSILLNNGEGYRQRDESSYTINRVRTLAILCPDGMNGTILSSNTLQSVEH